ncbi:aminotransferase class IV [Pseudonocardia hispaniensis]|uniref:Aminotransferase class IV n=1 Tax=Pseudonocardia hispaniensis TaxID=904933 RepID=A0ABW1IWL5_9PSEU
MRSAEGTGVRAGLARPEEGIFESLLVVDGHPRRLDAHLRRLGGSYRELYRRPLTADVAGAIAASVTARAGYLRVRVDARPEHPDRVRVRVREWEAPVPVAAQPGLLLRPVHVASGAAHKFADRGWIDRLEAALPEGTLPLLVDATGLLLESTRSNVAVVRDGIVATPPLDGRILPGTARQAMLAALEAKGARHEVRAVHLAELGAAEGVLLTNAIRGVQWVRSVEGVARFTAPDPVTTALGIRLSAV